ncbi:FTR1 family protein [Streptomyces coeruleoprunus]|uniref:FTR1 family protein n=1 Tax=Streptomyces coeruleoprunus TaxID=285563 RepID=A0ABV9X780_9ACTN
MLGIYLIGLRGALEASLVVCLLAAYLVRTGRREALRPVLAGAGAAVSGCLAFGCVLEFGPRELTFGARALLGGSLSVLAAVLVTWTFFALRRAERYGGREPGAGVVAATAFLAVGREGLETARFLWASVRAAMDEAGSALPLGGLLLGIATAALVGWLCCRGARLLVRPAWFSTAVGGLLVAVAAGMCAYGVRELQTAGVVGGLADLAFDVSGAVPRDGLLGTVVTGVFNFAPDPTVLQITVWALYPVPALALILSPVGFGRSGPSGRVEEQKATDEKAESGAGAGG